LCWPFGCSIHLSFVILSHFSKDFLNIDIKVVKMYQIFMAIRLTINNTRTPMAIPIILLGGDSRGMIFL
jgi:hypothetical protein